MPFIRDVSANYHSDKPSECYARRYTCMVHVGTYIALRPHRGFRVMDPQYRDILELHCTQNIWCSTHKKGPYIICEQCMLDQPLQICRLIRACIVCKLHKRSGPLLSAYRINGYCCRFWQTENVQIKLHGCTGPSGPSLFAYSIRTFFSCCTS